MDTRPGLARRLGTTDAVAIGLGSMIGAGRGAGSHGGLVMALGIAPAASCSS